MAILDKTNSLADVELYLEGVDPNNMIAVIACQGDYYIVEPEKSMIKIYGQLLYQDIAGNFHNFYLRYTDGKN